MLMRHQKYIYNNETLQFEAFNLSPIDKLKRLLRLSFAVLVTAGVIYFLVSRYTVTPGELKLQRELDQVAYNYQLLNQRVESMSSVLDNIQDRDANVHRFIFGLNPVDEGVWEGGIGGHGKDELADYPKTTQVIRNAREVVRKLERQMILQSNSLEEIEEATSEREMRYAHIPSLKPVRVDRLRYDIKMMSGFGMRDHPVHKVRRMHTGIDFSCVKGTPVQASGEGIVESVKTMGGYGKTIIIDHGFGYKSLYAHLSKYHVKKGDKVTKGQLIGDVGRTGTATASHLHYEVRINGEPVDPVHFCSDGLSPEDYQELVRMANEVNQSLD